MVKPTLVYLAVNPDYQKRGLGSSLVQIVEKIVHDKGDNILYVLDASPETDQFYARLGFEINEESNDLVKFPLTQFVDPPLPEGYSVTTDKYDSWNDQSANGLFIRLAEQNGVVIGKARVEWRNNG